MADRFSSTLAGIDRSRSSPNHGTRIGPPQWPDMLVLHYTGMRDAESAIAWLCNPASTVSCHYVVTEPGGILQLVDEKQRAWHAGRSCWAGTTDLNSASIGVEIVNGGHDFGLPAFPPEQIAAVISLSADIAARHGIEPWRILGHSDIAPSRKRDPGERFPWHELAQAGVGQWFSDIESSSAATALAKPMAGDKVAAFQTSLARYGYSIEATGLYDSATETYVRAFQRHFRPALVDGIADAETRGILAALNAAVMGVSDA